MNGGVDTRGALEAVDRILNRGGDPDDVLRAVLGALYVRGVSSARVRFTAGGALSVGGDENRTAVPVRYEGREVGTLELALGARAFAERIATLISAHVARRKREVSG